MEKHKSEEILAEIYSEIADAYKDYQIKRTSKFNDLGALRKKCGERKYEQALRTTMEEIESLEIEFADAANEKLLRASDYLKAKTLTHPPAFLRDKMQECSDENEELKKQIDALNEELSKKDKTIRRLKTNKSRKTSSLPPQKRGRKPISEDMRKKIIRLSKEDLTQREIAKKAGCGLGTVNKVLKGNSGTTQTKTGP